MKIVSLLPSATEIVFALGLEDQLQGVTFECDFPPQARSYPVISGTALATDGSMSAAEIDLAVSASVAADESIYTLDAERIRSIGPDLILAQDLCAVCAVPSGAVEAALDSLGCQAEVLSLDPGRLDEVIDCISAVGRATGTEGRADDITASLRSRLDAVRTRVGGLARPRVFALEWPDPPFNGGHWVPDMIEVAGGTPVLAAPGARSRRCTWSEFAAEGIDLTVFMPCGYDFDAVLDQAEVLWAIPEVEALGEIWAVDANAYFSRPGPRLVDGVEMLADIFHPRSSGIERVGSRLVARP